MVVDARNFQKILVEKMIKWETVQQNCSGHSLQNINNETLVDALKAGFPLRILCSNSVCNLCWSTFFLFLRLLKCISIITCSSYLGCGDLKDLTFYLFFSITFWPETVRLFLKLAAFKLCDFTWKWRLMDYRHNNYALISTPTSETSD